MPVFNPIVTVNAIPAVAVISISAPSYEEVRRSLGDNVYNVYRLYLKTMSSYNQLTTVFQYKKYDVNGTVTIHDITPVVDPNQNQPSLFYNVEHSPVIIDGQNSLNFILLANTTLKFKMYSFHIQKDSFVDAKGENLLGESNFKQFETATGNFGFFSDFNDSIGWNDKNKI